MNIGQVYIQITRDSIALPLEISYCKAAKDKWINVHILVLLITFMFKRKEA